MLKRLASLLLSFLAGLAGNLIAGWIQQDIWSNLFTPARILGTALGVGLMLLAGAWLENKLPAFLRLQNPVNTATKEKVESIEANREKTREKAIRSSINALDTYEKAVLREFFIQKRNTILVPEEDTAVTGLVQKGIIHIVGDTRYLLGVGWVCPVSLSPSAATIIRISTSPIIGFPPSKPTPEQIKEIQNSRPSFVWEIDYSSW